MTLHVENFESQQAMLDFANGRAARAVLLMPIPQHLTDEQALILDDGTNPPVEFRIDAGGDGVAAGTAVDTSAVGPEDKEALATALANAINGVVAGLAITATAVGEKVSLVNDAVGAAGNTSILQTVGGASLDALPIKFEGDSQFTGGSDAITTADITNIIFDRGLWSMFWRT